MSVPVSIKYAKGTVSAGMTVRVTASNRPLARVTEKTVKIKAGSSEQVNLLSDAYNPFPDTPLTVTGCTSDGASKLTVDCPSNGVVSIRRFRHRREHQQGGRHRARRHQNKGT